MQKRLSSRFWLALILFGFMGQVAWVVENMYLNVFLYKMFHATAGEISLMVAASAVAATLTTVLMGALSDKIGKRKIFICGGYILWGVSIFAFTLLRTDVLGSLFPMTVSAAALGVTLTITFDCLMTFFGSTANDAAFNAWLTESVDSQNRGKAEGVNAMMPLVAILAVFGGFMAFDLDKAESWQSIFIIIGAVVTGTGVLGLFLVRDKAVPVKEPYGKTLVYGFLPSTLKKNPSLYAALGLFVIFNIAIQIFMPYLILYYEVSLKMANYVFILAPAVILASVVTVLWGRVYDKKGFSLTAKLCLIWMLLGFGILYLFRDTLMVFVGSLLMMCGYLAGAAVFGAEIRDRIPDGKAGMLQGVRICSQVLIPGIIGPWIGKTVLKNAETIVNNDGTTSFVPNGNIFLAAFAVTAVLFLILLFAKKKNPPRLQTLTTPFEEDGGEGWTEYPRPQMKRESYLSLCGRWQLAEKNGAMLGDITVPFPAESRLSGLEVQLEPQKTYVYTRTFTLPANFVREKNLLHFGAVDQICTVSLNGEKAGKNEGGYLPFTLDVTPFLQAGENTLTVEFSDPLDTDLPYGKQTHKRGGMWYTPVSGIWQPVWLESVPKNHIEALKITPTLNSVTVEVTGGEKEKVLHVLGETYTFTGTSITVPVSDPVLWSPENPHLYEFFVESGEDRVESYFALRTVSLEEKNGQNYICLNGKPYFFHGLLDQGYFPDGIYLPATPRGFENDVLEMKRLGFNTLRKHIKIEPEQFYYYCDKHGMIVFQDMVNCGKYGFFKDTALPTVGIKKGIRHRVSQRQREVFESQCRKTLEHLHNHPCVCCYTIFNEGWGQYEADRIFEELKALDQTRVWDATSGWFTETKSDVDSHHVYFKKIKLKANPKRPLVLSEFGGYSCMTQGHVFNPDNIYGYKLLPDAEKLTEALSELYLNQVLPAVERGLNAAILTQVSDVEDEVNGLLTYDRRVCKVEEKTMQRVAEKLFSAFGETTR